MRVTKIMALHLGEIVKTVVFVIVGVAIVLLLINLFAPRNTERARERNETENEVSVAYIPGAYHVSLQLSTGTIDIEVIVSEDRILSIDFIDLPEYQQVFYPLFKPTMEILQASIVETQSLSVVVPEDRLITGQVLLSAIDKALAQAMSN